jgi:hypothetical protein
MKIQLPNSLLLFAAVACFVDSVHHPQHISAGPLLAAALGIFLLLKGLQVAPQPAVAILSGCILAALSVGRDQGFLNDNSPSWIVLFILAGAGCGFWERIVKLWKRLARRGQG